MSEKFFCRGRCYTPVPVLHTSTVPVMQVLTHKYKLQYLVLPLLSEVATGGIIEICTSENDSGTDVRVHVPGT